MAENTETLRTKLGIDTTDFKSGTAVINREIRLVESGFRASAAALGDWANDASGVEMRIKALNQQIDLQKLKVERAREEMERQSQAYGENSRQAKEAEIALNKNVEALGKMEAELNSNEAALSDMSQASNEASQSVDDMADSAQSGGDGVATLEGALDGLQVALGVTVAAITAMVGAMVGAGGAITALVFDVAASSAELADLSTKTGISTERLQELAYVGDQVGTSQETIVSSLTRLTRSMSEARQGNEGLQTAFERLGVSVTDSSGNLRDNEAVFADLIRQLGTVQNEAERDALAMEIFGKSAQELNPLIKAGVGQLAALSEEARQVGAVVSGENVQAFAEFQDTLDSLKAGLDGTLATLAASFLPGFQDVFDQLGGYLRDFSEIVRGSNGDFGQIAEGVSALLGRIITDVAQQAPQMLQAGFTLLQTLGNAILQSLPALMPVVVQMLMDFVKFFVDSLPLIINAALQLIIALAQGLTQALPTLVPAIIQALLTIVQTLVDNLPLLVDAATQLIQALAEGIIAALPILLEKAPEIYDSFADALIKVSPILLKAVVKLFGTLVMGIIQNLPLLTIAAWRMIGFLIENLGQAIVEGIPAMGQALVDGFKEGVLDNWDSLVTFLTDLFQSLFNDLMAIFTGGAANDIADMMANANTLGASSMGTGYSGGSVSSESYQFFAPVYIGGTSGQRLAKSIKAKRY